MYSRYADITNRLYLHADASLFTHQRLSIVLEAPYHMPTEFNKQALNAVLRTQVPSLVQTG